MTDYSSFEDRILAAALRLAQADDDPSEAGEAVSEIVRCARGMLRRLPEAAQPETIEGRRRAITLSEIPPAAESHVEYDDPKDAKP